MRVVSWRADRNFYLAVALTVIVFVFIGFAPSYDFKPYFDTAALLAIG